MSKCVRSQTEHFSFFYIVTGGGNYISGKIFSSENDLTPFKVGSNIMFTIGTFPLQSRIGVMIKKEDIILSREKIITSARNMVYGEVVDIIHLSNLVDLHLKSDELKLISRITRTSEEELGDHLYAIIKASAPHVVHEEVDKK